MNAIEAMRLRRERCAASKRHAVVVSPVSALQLEQQQHVELVQQLLSKAQAAALTPQPTASRRFSALGLRKGVLLLAALLSLLLPVRLLLAYTSPAGSTAVSGQQHTTAQHVFRSGIRFNFRRISYGKYHCERASDAEQFAPCTQTRPNLLFLYSPAEPPAAPAGSSASGRRMPVVMHFHGGKVPLLHDP